jgi:hemerythrin-like domain-containing protein
MATTPTFAPAQAAPLDAAILADPIEFIRFEHYRQRTLSDRLGRIAEDVDGAATARDAAWILDYLDTDLPLHIADEAEDLMPLLRERCASRDHVQAICDTLDREHKNDEQAKDHLLDGLRRLAARLPLANPLGFTRAALLFQDKLRRHLVWENQTLLPLARKRLWTGDVERLGLRMARRHGLPGRA